MAETPTGKFKTTVSYFLKNICEILLDMIDDGEKISISVQAVRIASNIIERYDGTKLINNFIDTHKDWKHVKTKNITYLTQTIPETYKSVPFDTKVLTTPVEKFEIWKAQGHHNGDTDTSNWPVTSDDIEDYWGYVRAMIKISCDHVHMSRKPVVQDGVIRYRNKDMYKDFPLEVYTSMFDVILTIT